ncbi:MAG: GGDEF domain-containing protein [Actinomycetes bacterium]
MPSNSGKASVDVVVVEDSLSDIALTDSQAHTAAWRHWVLPVIVPALLVALILQADLLEGPKTAYVGVLAVVPMLAAVFGTPLQTAIVGAVAWLAALGFGHLASDGNATSQNVRLLIIATSAVGAVFASGHRVKREKRLQEAERDRTLMEQMRYDATTDILTGALNRRGLVMTLEAIDRSGPITVAVADCDDFKLVNDRLGHLAGDRYLKSTALRLTRALSEQDIIGRWGGDEFLIALPLPLEEAQIVLERVNHQVTHDPVMNDSECMSVSLTFGATEWAADESLDSVVSRADQAMYEGKRSNQRINVG